jgi:hypothetical protein
LLRHIVAATLVNAHCNLIGSESESRFVFLSFSSRKLLSDFLRTLRILIAVVIYRWNVASRIYHASVELRF